MRAHKYTSKQEFQKLLQDLSIGGKKLTQQSLEAATIGFISETILREDQVLLSDRAGQFSILNHAGCWVHMERPLRKIPVTNPGIEEEIKGLRSVIWETYRKLKEVVVKGTGKEDIEFLYDKIVATTSSSPQIAEVVKNFRDYRGELLKALDYPMVPLHNNGSEQSVREMVKRRDVSGSTHSEEGQKFRDGLATVKQTCRKLGLSLYSFVLQRFRGKPLDLSELVHQCYRSSS